MASRIAGVGRVTVSERRSIMPHLIADGADVREGERRSCYSAQPPARLRAKRARSPRSAAAAQGVPAVRDPTFRHPQLPLSMTTGPAALAPPAPPAPTVVLPPVVEGGGQLCELFQFASSP